MLVVELENMYGGGAMPGLVVGALVDKEEGRGYVGGNGVVVVVEREETRKELAPLIGGMFWPPGGGSHTTGAGANCCWRYCWVMAGVGEWRSAKAANSSSKASVGVRASSLVVVAVVFVGKRRVAVGAIVG